jgi:two-component system alkaline phosphatase synthesis response regulator PhoP
MSARVLLVEDEPGIVQVLVDLLEAEGHVVETAGDGETGLQLACSGSFDLLILDVMLPGLSGIDVCHGAREQGYDGAILMLTALGRVPDRVRGLRSGADDYLTKPFDPDELLARVDALLRRTRQVGLTPVMRVEFGDIVADFSQGLFTKNGVPVNLAAKEAELLRLLINRRGQVISRAEILGQIWADQPFITPRTVDVHVAWLRQKIEGLPNTPRHILTVRGEGYRFVK